VPEGRLGWAKGRAKRLDALQILVAERLRGFETVGKCRRANCSSFRFPVKRGPLLVSEGGPDIVREVEVAAPFPPVQGACSGNTSTPNNSKKLLDGSTSPQGHGGCDADRCRQSLAAKAGRVIGYSYGHRE